MPEMGLRQKSGHCKQQFHVLRSALCVKHIGVATKCLIVKGVRRDCRDMKQACAICS